MPLLESQTVEFKGHGDVGLQLGYPAVERYFGGQKQRNIGEYVCAFLNGGNQGTLYLGVHDNGTIQGCTLNDEERDQLNQHWSGRILTELDPDVNRDLVTLQWREVYDRPATQQNLSICVGWVAVVHVMPDPSRRLFWFKGDCHNGGIAKMPPSLIRERLKNLFIDGARKVGV
jgi:hypothetical protein